MFHRGGVLALEIGHVGCQVCRLGSSLLFDTGGNCWKGPASSKSLIRHLSSIRRHFFVTRNRARSCEITIISHTLLSISLFSTLIAGGIPIAPRILQQ